MRRLAGPFFALLSVVICGCGGGGDDDEAVDAVITQMGFDDPSVSVGDGSVLNVNFDFSTSRIFRSGDEVAVLLELPPSLRYRDSSAESHRDGGETNVSVNEVTCPSGYTYLQIYLGSFDLPGSSKPNGTAEGDLTLTLDGVSPQVGAIVLGSARYNSVYFTCDDGLLNEDSFASITVTRR